MNFYECHFPFYALIKAKTLRQAKQLYKKEVWIQGGEDWQLISKDTAILKYGMLRRERHEAQFLVMDLDGPEAKIIMVK
ncbi:hypothetical protein [Geomicrobium sediminis]|uniref:Uncharacterized protein n=1 Tax=Geomicrobium sediminis TaxID=1347788 RepID=A0ABS2PD72_9BACL|nr:hypothetical protein [Geomicrobium sediminis]MBM7633222.1 hypothetical protein [Geomicrobium sediminis]